MPPIFNPPAKAISAYVRDKIFGFLLNLIICLFIASLIFNYGRILFNVVSQFLATHMLRMEKTLYSNRFLRFDVQSLGCGHGDHIQI